MLWRLLKRKMGQTAEQETDRLACTGRFERRATRRRLNHSAGQSQTEAALQTRAAHRAPEWRHSKMEAAAGTVQSAPAWRLYAGNGTYSNTRLAATCELSSCAPKPQLNRSRHKIKKMISDAAISAANLDVEKAEQELKSLSEALDRVKVRSL